MLDTLTAMRRMLIARDKEISRLAADVRAMRKVLEHIQAHPHDYDYWCVDVDKVLADGR